MTLTIELSEDIYEAVRLEAEQHGFTVKERVERMITKTHEHRVKHPLTEMQTYLNQIDTGEVAGDGTVFRDLVPTSKSA